MVTVRTALQFTTGVAPAEITYVQIGTHLLLIVSTDIFVKLIISHARIKNTHTRYTFCLDLHDRRYHARQYSVCTSIHDEENIMLINNYLNFVYVHH